MLKWVLVALGIVLMLMMAVIKCSICMTPTAIITTIPDPTDYKMDNGISLVTDYGTGCQYLIQNSSGSNPVPRLDSTGKQICKMEYMKK